MPGRKYVVENGYRYGFNGQEKSTEIDPNGNSMTAEFWQYDARLGRRWNVDPRPSVDISVYAAFANNPIYNSDLLGDTTVPGDWYRRQDGKNINYKYAAGSEKKHLDADSKTWWKIPEASRNRVITFGKTFAPTEVQSSIDLHADGTFTVLKTDIREGAVEGHIKWKMQLPNGGNLSVEARDYMQSKAVGDGSFWGAAGALAGDKVIKVGGTVISKLASKGGVTFYRAMSNAEYAALQGNNGLTYMTGKELFVSTSADYSRAYLQKSGYDVLVQFNMKSGAMKYFNEVGVFHRTAAGSSGWAGRGSLLWKSEQGVTNLGIQSNTHMFNPWIQNFKAIK